MEPQFKLPQKAWMKPAPSRNAKDVLTHLKNTGVLPHGAGHKRKHADSDGVRLNNQSRAPTTPETFKRPRLFAPQSRRSDEERSGETMHSNKRRTESYAPSPRTPVTNASDRPSSTLSSKGSRASQYPCSIWRADHTPTSSHRTQKDKPHKPSFMMSDTRDNSSRSTVGDRPSDQRHPTYRPLENSPATENVIRRQPSATIREHTTANGRNFHNDNYVPTIDRRIQHPPPQHADLTRVLAQVPDILKDLGEKQAEVIRSLIKRVNKQEDEIKGLWSRDAELTDQITTNNNLIAELANRFEQAEKKFGIEIETLKQRNEEMEDHINRTGENIVAQVKSKLVGFEEQTTTNDHYEPSEDTIYAQDPKKAEEEHENLFVQQE